jgi:hypothetical protein
MAWLEQLRTATSSYAARPYRQLAATYQAEGHEVHAIVPQRHRRS